LTLTDLRIRELNAELLDPSPSLPFASTLSVQPRVGIRPGYAVYDVLYDLSGADSRNADVFRIRLAFNLLFKVGDETLSTADLEAFGAVGVVEVVHPYARETVHSISMRMGLPAFLLDIDPPVKEN
jgi:hypothetical protein